jgi:hypothetical protein
MADAEGKFLSPETPFPDMVDFKDFGRYKVMRMKGVITPVPKVDLVKTNLESFFSGFWRRTGTYYAKEDRPEFYRVGLHTLTDANLNNPLTLTVCQGSPHRRGPMYRHPVA